MLNEIIFYLNVRFYLVFQIIKSNVKKNHQIKCFKCMILGWLHDSMIGMSHRSFPVINIFVSFQL